MVLITIVTGAYKATNITGGPHIVVTMSFETALLTTELFSIRISGDNSLGLDIVSMATFLASRDLLNHQPGFLFMVVTSQPVNQ